MVNFTRVKDPERAKAGDLLLFPKGVKSLDLKARTIADYGLSVGDTSRSDNSWTTVCRWLERKDEAARLFMIVGPQYMAGQTDDELLLSLDSTVKKDREDPLIHTASLVPFGPAFWSMRQWVGCWDATTDGAVGEALARKMGAANVLANEPPMRDGKKVLDDRFASQVWDTDDELSNLDGNDACNTSDEWFPMMPRGCREVNGGSYELSTVARWGGCGWGEKKSRITFKSGFLANLAKKGAIVTRPTEEFRELVTESCVAWWCAEMARRFERRHEASKFFMAGLSADMKRDKLRAVRYARQCRKSGNADRPLRAMLLKETGVVS